MSTPGKTPLAPFTTIGSPFDVSGYMVTLGAAAVALPDEALEAGEAEPLAAAVEAADATDATDEVAEVASPIADETEASCRGRSGEATTPEIASKGRSRTSIIDTILSLYCEEEVSMDDE